MSRKGIAIVGGTAGLGYGLALRIARGGEPVVIGSRDAERAAGVAAGVRTILPDSKIEGMLNEEAVRNARLVFVTVPFPGQAATYKLISSALSAGTVVCDCTVPLASEVGGRATRVLGVWEGSAAQQGRAILGKGFPFAAGFHTVMARLLIDLARPVDSDVFVCGEDDAKDVIAPLIETFGGARFVDCGPLETARILEHLTALLIGLNIRYQLDPGAGFAVTGLGLNLPRRQGRSDSSRAAKRS